MSTVKNKIVTVGQVPYVLLDEDPTMAANSDKAVPSQKAVKTAMGGTVTPTGTAYTATPLTVSGEIPIGASFVTLNHAATAIAATIASPTPGRFLVITQIDAGSQGHTVTLTAGTFDGTNDVATFNAAGETLVLFGVSATRFVIVENIGTVGLS